MASDEGSSVASSEIDRLLGISEGEDDEDGGEPDTSFVSRLSAADDATTSPGEGGDRTWAAPAGPLGHEDSYGSPNMTAEAPVPEFHSSDSQHAPSAESWARLNDALQQNGFPALPIVTLFAEPRSGAPSFVLSPDPARLFQTLDTVLTNYANRGRVLSDTAGRGAFFDYEQQQQTSAERSAKAREHAAQELATSNARVGQLRARARELEEANENLRRETRQLRSTAGSLAQQLKHSENRVRAKESVAEKLTARLRGTADRERAARTHEKSLFKTMQRRDARPDSTADSRTVEIIHVYERQRQKMSDELSVMREEVQSLNDTLREKENFIMQNELGGAWDGGHSSDAAQIADKYEEQQRVARLMRQRETTLKRSVAQLEHELKESHVRARELEDVNDNLKLELKSRPSVRAWTNSQRCIQDLEYKLEAAVDSAKEAEDVRELRKYMGTRALIERDRINYKLHLDSLDALPREIAKEILQETCRELQVSDVSLIGSSIRKMTKVLLMVPRLERFVQDVASFVFRQEASEPRLATEAVLSQHSMEEVVPILVRWRQELTSLSKSDQLLEEIVGELRKREVDPDGYWPVPATSAGRDIVRRQICKAVSDLVTLERNVLTRREVYESAEVFVRQGPEILVNRVILHLQYLFDIKTMAGLFPKINEIYLFVNEVSFVLPFDNCRLYDE
jgi:hypothetical protein